MISQAARNRAVILVDPPPPSLRFVLAASTAWRRPAECVAFWRMGMKKQWARRRWRRRFIENDASDGWDT